MGQRFSADSPGAALQRGIWLAGSFVGSEFQGAYEAALPRDCDMWMFGEAAEVIAEPRDFGGQIGECLFLFKHFERGKSGRTSEWVTAEGVAVVKRAARVEFAKEGMVNGIVRQRGGEWQVTAGKALSQAEEIGHDGLLLAGEHRTGTTETDGDFVGN